MCNKTDKTEKYFTAWAGRFPKLNSSKPGDEPINEILGFKNMNDLKLHIYNVFLISMFYECIDRDDISIPDPDDISTPDPDNVQYFDTKIGTEGRAIQSEIVQNDPSKWMDFYQKNYEYFSPITWGKKDYIIMHSGLYDVRTDVFIIFMKVQSETPYKLVAISTTQNCIWHSCDDINRDNARDICSEAVVEYKCKRIVPFSSITDVIFDCNKLPEWNNPNRISGSTHAWTAHPERGYTEEDRKNMCINACIKSISNYRYAYPYVYYDSKSKGLCRGFLLPLENEGEVVLVATVMKNERGKYRINTVLTPLMAIEQARRVSTIEVDWMSRLL